MVLFQTMNNSFSEIYRKFYLKVQGFKFNLKWIFRLYWKTHFCFFGF